MAGRPVGSKNLPKIRDYITSEQVKELTLLCIEKAKEDNNLLKFVIEQIYGKAPLPVVGGDGGVLQIVVKRYEDTDKGDTTS